MAPISKNPNIIQESAIDMKIGPVIPCYKTINFSRNDVTNYSANYQNLAKNQWKNRCFSEMELKKYGKVFVGLFAVFYKFIYYNKQKL